MIKSCKHWVVVLLIQLCLASHISFYVRYLDKKICDAIENPVSRGGKYLYRDLLDMAIKLQRIEHLMKDENRKGEIQAKEIIEEGGINFPNVTQNAERIMAAFNWTKEEAEELRVKTESISRVWQSILKNLVRKPLYPVDYDLDSEKFVKVNATT